MLSCTIIAVGSLRNESCRALVAEYSKRLTPYARLELIEVPASAFRHESDREKAQLTEASKISAQLNRFAGASKFLLDERGKQYTSVEFATLLKEQSVSYVFILGGALGFHSSLRERPDLQLISLSNLTLPHELARVLLLEQLYRAVTIQNNKIYHY